MLFCAYRVHSLLSPNSIPFYGSSLSIHHPLLLLFHLTGIWVLSKALWTLWIKGLQILTEKFFYDRCLCFFPGNTKDRVWGHMLGWCLWDATFLQRDCAISQPCPQMTGDWKIHQFLCIFIRFIIGRVFVLLRLAAVLFYFNFSLSGEYVMVFPWGFIYISITIRDLETVSMCLLAPCPGFVKRWFLLLFLLLLFLSFYLFSDLAFFPSISSSTWLAFSFC